VKRKVRVALQFVTWEESFVAQNEEGFHMLANTMHCKIVRLRRTINRHLGCFDFNEKLCSTIGTCHQGIYLSFLMLHAPADVRQARLPSFWMCALLLLGYSG